MKTTKKLIEVALPLEAINKAAREEKSVPRHGHPQTLHFGWARRPLAAARAVIFARMMDDPSAATKNEILTSLNKPDDFILGIVEFRDDDTQRVHYLRSPFQREPDFGVTSVNYAFQELLSRATPPA